MLCQVCVLLKRQRVLCLPMQDERLPIEDYDGKVREHLCVERDLGVCYLCYDRISNAITQGLTFDVSVVGQRILGVRVRMTKQLVGGR